MRLEKRLQTSSAIRHRRRPEPIFRTNTYSMDSVTNSGDVLSSEDCSGRIESLRALLRERPKNARVASQLACLLAEKAKGITDRSSDQEKTNSNADDVTPSELLAEAICLAERATQLAPSRPFGFAALSLIAENFDERMKNLKIAIGLSSTPQHAIARAGLLVRLLVEPRDHESRLLREANSVVWGYQHPSKRDCNKDENALYAKLSETLDECWRLESLSEYQTEFLAKIEYRLGLFFRKKQPPTIHRQKSIQHFSKAREKLPPSHSISIIAQFWLATLSGDSANSVMRCPKDYIVRLYSTFAERFDNLLLGSLKYVTPTELRRLLDQVVVSNSTYNGKANKWLAQKGLDMGCGSGLSGEAFRDCVGHLVGVDLSPEMLAKAKLRSCYDHLFVGDCIGALTGEANFDLIVACDVFVYIGDLQETFSAAHSSLSETGFFAFSTELLDEAKQDCPFALHECARFAHKRSYIESLATSVGFDICGYKVCSIRKNQGKDVFGSLVVLRRQ
jgi:predicted TPR repeat methyltransferase